MGCEYFDPFPTNQIFNATAQNLCHSVHEGLLYKTVKTASISQVGYFL